MTLTSYDLCGPDPKPMTVGEVDALKELMAKLPENPVVIQIGAERGVSTLAMLEARPDAFILSVDVGARPEEVHNLQAGGHDVRRVVRALGRSQNIGLYWPDYWRCDLLYIDGDHRRPGIDEDLERWPRAMEPGGYIVLHDYIHPADRGPQIQGRVWEAVQDWLLSLPGLIRLSQHERCERLVWWRVELI